MGSVCIDKDSWRKIEEYTALCPVEIACMGYAKLDGHNVVVDEVFLVPQVISLSSVEFLDKGLPWAVNKAIEDDRINDLRFCWHSHATHDSYFSPTDEEMVRKVKASAPLPWFVSVVLNKKGKTHAQLDYFKPGGELAEFTDHITIALDVVVDGVQVDATDQRLLEMEEFTEKKTDYDRKHRATKAKSPSSSILPLEPIHAETEWTETITGRDWRLHNEASDKDWEVYIKDDVAYYWSDETREFKGSAPIPINPKTGDYKIEIEPTVIDGTAEEPEDAELVPIDEAEENMIDRAQAAGLL